VVTRGISIGGTLLTLAVACGTGRSSLPAAPPAADGAWRHGPRDSALAAAVACHILRTINRPGQECIVTGYRETAAEYVLRIGEHGSAAAARPGVAGIEVHLTKQGDSATVKQLPLP
jgi:hypothetical protein